MNGPQKSMSSISDPRSWLCGGVLWGILALTYCVYAPGFDGIFLFDDYHNIVNNTAVQIESLSLEQLQQAADSSRAGPLKRPVSMLTFALNYYFSGLDAYAFKRVNLLIHLLNGIAVYVLSHLLLTAYRFRLRPDLSESRLQWMSIAIAGAWLLHPINLTSVLYVVQRMTSLAALFTFTGLILAVWGRLRQQRDQSGAILLLLSLLVAAPLSALSKENGLLFPLFLGLIELAVFRFQAATLGGRRFVIGVFLATFIFPIVAATTFVIVKSDWILGGYSVRDFTLAERLLTESRVIWTYLQLIFTPALSKLGIYHDDIQLSHSLLDPPTTSLALLGLIALVGVALSTIKRYPLFSFGLLFFLVGHSMESTIFGLEIAHEHRNYLPLFGLLLTLFYVLLNPDFKWPQFRHFAALGLVIAFGSITALRAATWGEPIEQLLINTRYHTNSPRANYDAGVMYFHLSLDTHNKAQREIYYERSRHFFLRASESNKLFATGLIASLWLDSAFLKPVDQERLSELLQRLRTNYISAFTVSTLQQLQKCNLEGRCSLSTATLGSLFTAAVDNPRSNKAAQGVLLAESIIWALSNNSLDQALEFARRAKAANADDPQHTLNLANLLIEAKQLDAAERELAELIPSELSSSERRRFRIQWELLEQVRQRI